MGVAARGFDQPEVVPRRGGIRMIFAARFSIRLDRLPEERFGRRQMPVQPQYGGEIALADRGFAMILSERSSPDLQGFSLQRAGTIVQSLILVDAPQFHHGN